MLTNISVLYLDPFVEQKLTYNGKEFGVPRERSTKVVSRVSYSDIIIHSFKASAAIAEGELKTMVEIKMYEEAGLDLQKRYKMTYIRKELELSDMVLVEAFAIEESKTRTTLSRVLQDEKYIDFLALPFLAFSTLYTHKILAPQNDLFVYIDRQEAFLALYKNGHYVSTKSIMSLEDMLKRLKREEIDLSIEALQKILTEKGVDADAYGAQELSLSSALQNLFVDIFTKINDILMHNRNVFGIDTINRIFMSTANGRVRGLREFLKAFGYEQTTIHDFKLVKDAPKEHLFASIVATYAHEQCTLEQSQENITFFVRPPAFLKTQTGQLTLWSAASLVVCALYPLYLYWASYNAQQELTTLQAQYEEVKKNVASFNAKLTQIKNDLNAATTLKSEQTKALENIDQSLDQLYAMKISSQSSVDFIAKVNELLGKYQLMVRSIEQKGTHAMRVEVVANQAQRDNIAKFMEALLREGFVGVSTDEVHSDKLLYISKIEIAR